MKNLRLFLIIFIAFYTIDSFSRQNDAPCTPVPINDSPCMSNANPPYDLGYFGDHSGTTCCAIGFNDDANADKANEGCSTAYDDDAVWYRMNVNHDFDGIMVSIYTESGTTIGFEHSVEVYEGGEDAICDGTANLIKTYCIGEEVSESYMGCIKQDFVFIKITSTESDCGTFHIDVQQNNIWNGADRCENVSDEETLYPITSDDIDEKCVSGQLNNLFCPDAGLPGGCDVFETNPTIWFKVVVDEDANLLYTNVIPEVNWTPVWSVYKGDCYELENVTDSYGYSCSLESNPPSSPMWTSVSEGIYYIAVSSLEGNISNPYFSFCAATTKSDVNCMGEEDSCDKDESTSFVIINRENSELEPNGSPFNGPFCPGEKLTVQVEFTYHTDQTNDERLLAMIPDFGSGWDIDYYELYSNPPVAGNNEEADWYDEDSHCYPYVTETFDNLCVYVDENSKLHICNPICEDCPCNAGMVEGDPIPSGYFWVNNSDENNCDPSDCSPSTKRGVEGDNGETTVIWTIELKVKNTVDSVCLDNDDLSISFLTFSDGGAGCHNDSKAECLLDKPQHSPDWKINCQSNIYLLASPQTKEICSGDTVGIKVKSVDDTTKTIIVSFDDNPFVLGEKKDTFKNGFGIINDTLTLLNNEVCGSQVVYYYTEILDAPSLCIKKKDTIKVFVYSKPWPLVKKMDETSVNANDGNANLIFECIDEFHDIKWSTGDTTEFVENLAPGKYYVTITNEIGCDTVQEIIINGYGCTEFTTSYTTNDVSCFGDCTGKIYINSVFNGNLPYSYLWSTGDTTDFVDGLCAGNYTLTITDNKNCNFIDTILISSPSELSLNISSTGETFVNGKNGTAQVSPVGGTSPYKITWSTGDSSLIIDNLSQGMYFVTLTDANGCSQSDSTSVEPFECGDLSIVSQKKDVSCFEECDGSINISDVTNSHGVLIYTWQNGSSSNSLNNLCKGTYNIIITDSLRCVAMYSYTIKQPDEILISIDNIKNITNSGLGEISVSTNGNYSYEWNGPNGLEGNSKDISGLDTAGCYTLVVTDTINNCSKDTTVCITNTTAINEINNEKSLVYLYPNPTKNSFYINFKEFNNSQAFISLIDVSGKEVFTTKLTIKNKTNKINIDNIKKGLYFVKIRVDNKIIFKKLIIGM